MSTCRCLRLCAQTLWEILPVPECKCFATSEISPRNQAMYQIVSQATRFPYMIITYQSRALMLWCTCETFREWFTGMSGIFYYHYVVHLRTQSINILVCPQFIWERNGCCRTAEKWQVIRAFYGLCIFPAGEQGHERNPNWISEYRSWFSPIFGDSRCGKVRPTSRQPCTARKWC